MVPPVYRAARAVLARQQSAWMPPAEPPTVTQLLDAQLDLCAVLGREALDVPLTDISVSSMTDLQAGREVRLYCGAKVHTALRQRWIHALARIMRWHGAEVEVAKIGSIGCGSDLTWTTHPAVLQALQRCRSQLHHAAQNPQQLQPVSLPHLLNFIAWHHLAGGDGRSTLQHAMAGWVSSLSWDGAPGWSRPVVQAYRAWVPEQGYRTLAEAAHLCGATRELCTHLGRFDATPPWLVPHGTLVAGLADANLAESWAQIRERLWAEHGYAAPVIQIRTFGGAHIPLHVLRAIGRLFPATEGSDTAGLAVGIHRLRWGRVLRRAGGLMEMPDPTTYQPSNGGRYFGMRLLDAAAQADLNVLAAWALPPTADNASRQGMPILPLRGVKQHEVLVMQEVLHAAQTLARSEQ